MVLLISTLRTMVKDSKEEIINKFNEEKLHF